MVTVVPPPVTGSQGTAESPVSPVRGFLFMWAGAERVSSTLKMLIRLEGAHGFCVSIFGLGAGEVELDRDGG